MHIANSPEETNSDAEADSEDKPGGKEDPTSLLVYPIPEEQEDEDGLTTASEDSEWEPVEVRRRKVLWRTTILHIPAIDYSTVTRRLPLPPNAWKA